jgi:hypothetical protein
LRVGAAKYRQPFWGSEAMSLKDAIGQFTPAARNGFAGGRKVFLERIHDKIVADLGLFGHW